MSGELTLVLPESAALPGRAPWITALRERGAEAFRAQGLPGGKIETWRYSHQKLKSLARGAFRPAVATDVPSFDALPRRGWLDLGEATTIVLMNGRWVPALSSVSLPKGVSVAGLAETLESAPDSVASSLGKVLPLDGYPFAALNTGLLADGVVVRVADGVTVERPLQIVSLTAPDAEPMAVAPRLLISVGAGASVTVAESHLCLESGAVLVAVASEIALAAGASLRHILFQNQGTDALHLATTQAVLGRNARYERFSLTLGAALARDDVRVELAGEGATTVINGAYALKGAQHLDTASYIDHAVPGCTSSQVYKGVLDGEARGVFQGRVHIRPDAQKSSGQQLHKALLLSRRAEVDVKPELTIHADDVQCSHGATAGELDDQALFYLRTRGLDEETARGLLIEGFLDDVIGMIADEAAQTALTAEVHGWLEERTRARP